MSPLVVSGNDLVPSEEQARIQRLSPGRDIFRKSFEDVLSSPMVVPEGKSEDDDKSASQLLDGWRSGSDRRQQGLFYTGSIISTEVGTSQHLHPFHLKTVSLLFIMF